MKIYFLFYNEWGRQTLGLGAVRIRGIEPDPPRALVGVRESKWLSKPGHAQVFRCRGRPFLSPRSESRRRSHESLVAVGECRLQGLRTSRRRSPSATAATTVGARCPSGRARAAQAAAGGLAGARPYARYGLEREGALGPIGLRARGSACERSSWVVRGHGPMFRGERRMKNVHQA